MGRVTCADLAELRSAYIDEALGRADRERVLLHLAGCERCRAEVEELRQVRSILTHRLATRPGVRPPEHLPDRLLAIAERPATRRGSGVPGLPGRWRRARRRSAVALAALGLGAVAATGLGLAAAPATTLTTVSQPQTEAAAELGDVIQQLPFGNQAAAALVDVPGGAVAAVPTGRPSATGAGDPLTGSQLNELLVRMAEADSRTRYSGTQQYFAARGGDRVAARLAVYNLPDQGRRVVAYDAAGREVGADTRPAETTSRLSGNAAAALLTAGYRLEAWPTADVLGRDAVVLEARSRSGAGSVGTQPAAARWWVDATTGVMLWQETYDADGVLTLSSGFTDLRWGGDAPLPGAAEQPVPSSTRVSASLTVSRADVLADAGWACSEELAGLPLIRLRSDATADPGVVHMIYSDGVSTVSVVEQRGRLQADPSHWDTDLGAYVQRGGLTSASWQSGDSVVTVVTDAAPQVLTAVVAALPHEPMRTATTMDRVVAGWARILGAG